MNHNLLFIGDMHVKKDNVDESERIVDFAISEAVKNNASIAFSGDQYNDHGTISAIVLDFWKRAYEKIFRAGIKSYSLIGNHDLSSDYRYSPMYVHGDHTEVILVGTKIMDSVGAIGYTKNNDEFKTTALALYERGCRIILCHAEFDGAAFDNGFYVPNGLKISDFPFDLVFVSGHIHSRQELVQNFGGPVRVYYSGTPRMLTRSDISHTKSIMLIDSNQNTFSHIPVPESVSEPFSHTTVTDLSQISNIKNSDRVYVDIKGSKEFIEKAVALMPSSVKIRTIPEIEQVTHTTVSESAGINTAFATYISEYIQKEGVSPDIIEEIYQYIPSWR